MLTASPGGNRVPVIAQLMQTDEDTVRDMAQTTPCGGANRRKKGAANTLCAPKPIRAPRPDGAPIYVNLDSLPAHEGEQIRRRARKNHPTGSSARVSGLLRPRVTASEKRPPDGARRWEWPSPTPTT